jgi:hypothetical protein
MKIEFMILIDAWSQNQKLITAVQKKSFITISFNENRFNYWW